MFSGDGSDKLKTGLADNWRVLSVIGATLVAAALMLWLLQPKDPELPLYKPDDAKAAGYQADAANCSPDALAAIGDVRKRAAQRNDCADKAEDHRLKTDDLIQQTRAADAARAQAISAGYQSWLALWATVGGFLTLVAAGLAAAYARDAAKEGKRSADAAHAALVEAKKANHISRDANRRQSLEERKISIRHRIESEARDKSEQRRFRAYLDFESVDLSKGEVAIPAYCPQTVWRNFGQTPATNFGIITCLRVGESNLTASEIMCDVPDVPRAEGRTLVQNQTTKTFGAPLTTADFRASFEKTHKILFLARVEYADVIFGDDHVTQRCWEIRVENAALDDEGPGATVSYKFVDVRELAITT